MPLTYALNAGNTSYSVTTGSCTAGAVSIPSTYNGLPVTGIINSAFTNCATITSLSIPSSITVIQGFALSGCTSLTSITVDGSNPNYSSSDGILFNKTGTTLVSYPAGLSGSYTIGSGVTSIGDSAFFGCVNLTGITIGSNVSSIGISSFRSCTGLTNVNIPSSVLTIGLTAFFSCINLATITFNGSNLTTIGDFAFSQSGVSSIVLPNSVASLGGSAFQQCSNLVTATLGTTLTSISSALFQGCGGLLSVTIPSEVTTLGGNAFYTCTNLSSVTFAGNKVISIGSLCFYQCYQLKSINLPTTLTTLFASVFGYSGLESITLPNSLVTMGASVFFGCASLKNVYFGNGLISINANTFNSCTSLNNVIIPERISSIGNSAFFSCTSLSKVFLRGTTPPGLGTNVFAFSPTTIYRRKNFTTGFESTLGGRPVDIWSDNLIKSGGTGKLIGKKRFIYTYDPDAITYINNVEIADSQALEETTKIAINDFVISCKNDSTWNIILSCCILAGARTLSGALTPLKGTAPTNNGFNNEDYTRSLGLIGASNKYLNSNILTNSLGKDDGYLYAHISSVSADYPVNRVYIGSVVNPNSDISMIRRNANSTSVDYFLNSPFNLSGSIGAGGRGVARSGGWQLSRIQGGSSSQSSSTSYNHNSINIYVMCVNENGSPNLYAINERVSFYMIGNFKSNPHLFSNKVATLMSALSSL